MGAHRVLRIPGLLRVAALAGAAAALLLIAPSQTRAADPLADAADHVGEVTAPIVQATGPIVEAATPVVEAIEPVTDPVVEATQPVTDPVVEATKPLTDPVVESTKPIIDEIVGRIDPIVDLPPTRPAPAPITAPATADDVTVRRASITVAEHAAPMLSVAAQAVSTELTVPSGADDTTTAPFFTSPAGRGAVTALSHELFGSGSPITNAGAGLLIGMLAATLMGFVAGWRSFSFERLRLPFGLVLAPPVPPG
jgi:hypothetical protein